MAFLYSLVYLGGMTSLLVAIGMVAGAADAEKHPHRRRSWMAALAVLLFNLLLFLPVCIWAFHSDRLYDLSDWLEQQAPPCPATPGELFDGLSTGWHKRKLNRASGALLASASWAYQWIYLLPWMIWGRWRSLSSHLLWERGLLWGAGLTALFGVPCSLWIIWDGIRCGG
jgi:hypothetical protein